MGRGRKGVPVVAEDADGNRVLFPSMSAAARAAGVETRDIWAAVNFGYPCAGWLWKEDKHEDA